MARPENRQTTLFDDPPPIAREVEVRVVDLHSFQVMRNVVYAGHIGLTLSSGAFYLYLNARYAQFNLLAADFLVTKKYGLVQNLKSPQFGTLVHIFPIQ